MFIEELLKSWYIEDGRCEPQIVSPTWHGTKQSRMMVDLWGQQYARAYGWMLSLGITSQLWQDFGDLACAEFQKGLVFDAGIGRGDIAKRLLDNSPDIRVIGGDWPIPFLQRAQKNLGHKNYEERIALCHMDLTHPWSSEWEDSFDGVVCNYVAAYMSIEAQKTLLTEAFRVLHKEGVLFFNFMILGVEFKDVIKNNVPEELRRNPFVLLRALLLIPIFNEKVDKARETNLIQSFAQKEFEELLTRSDSARWWLLGGISHFQQTAMLYLPTGWSNRPFLGNYFCVEDLEGSLAVPAGGMLFSAPYGEASRGTMSRNPTVGLLQPLGQLSNERIAGHRIRNTRIFENDDE